MNFGDGGGREAVSRDGKLAGRGSGMVVGAREGVEVEK